MQQHCFNDRLAYWGYSYTVKALGMQKYFWFIYQECKRTWIHWFYVILTGKWCTVKYLDCISCKNMQIVTDCPFFYITQYHMTPHSITCVHTLAHRTLWHHITSHNINVTSHHTVPHNTISHYIELQIPHHATPYYLTSYHNISHHITIRCYITL